MGKKLDAMLGRNFKTSKLKALLNLAISRLAVLKNQRQARCSVARSDTLQLLNLGDHERALIRVEQVIKEQNMLDVFLMIEGYCVLVVERLNLIEQERVCPDELKEAISSLVYAASRCGEFPELQEMRAVFMSRFGKEFVARAAELRNNCGVNPKMIQKLSTRQPSLENRMKVLREMAAENGIVLLIDEPSPEAKEEKLDMDQKQNLPKPDPSVPKANSGDNLKISADDIEKIEGFSDAMARRKYRDVADAAQAAFESAAYAAAAARAAMELSRPNSDDPSDPISPGPRWAEEPLSHKPIDSKLPASEERDSRGIEDPIDESRFEKIHPIQNYQSDSEDDKIQSGAEAEEPKQTNNASQFKRSDPADKILGEATTGSDAVGETEPLGTQIIFDQSDDEIGNEGGTIPLSVTGDLAFNMRPSLLTNEILTSDTVKDEDLLDSEAGGEKLYHPSHKQFPLRSQAGLNMKSDPQEPKAHSIEGSKTQSAWGSKAENKPVSVRTRLSRWHH